MPRDKHDRSPLQLAIQHGKWRSLQLILDAIIRGNFSVTPAPSKPTQSGAGTRDSCGPRITIVATKRGKKKLDQRSALVGATSDAWERAAVHNV